MNKAIFLDRDGTLNPDPGFISRPEDFNLFEGVTEALKKLKCAGYLLILITNQSGISRGLITEKQLEAVHNKLKRLLKEAGAELDGIYYCPHHPEHPYKGISVCNCRKPAPGLILKAIEEHNIDSSRSYMIGDRKSDIKIGLNSNVQPIFICERPIEGYEKIPSFKNLMQAADYILSK